MKRNSWLQFLITFVLSSLVLSLVLIGNKVYNVPIIKMTRDISTLGNIHPLWGFLSSFGILLWAATATTCLFSSTFFFNHEHKDNFRFLVYVGLLSTYLLFDDLFCIHEGSERWLPGGEKTIVIMLGLAVLIHLVLFKKIILQSNFFMLIIALSFLFISNVIDTIQPFFWEKGDLHAFIEDGTKWIGIIFWSSFYIEASHRLIKRII